MSSKKKTVKEVKEVKEDEKVKQEVKNSEEVEHKPKCSKLSKKQKSIIFIVSLLIFVLSTSYLIYYFVTKSKDKQEIKEVQEYVSPKVEENKEENLKDKVKQLQSANEDVKAWIEIKDTIINYPVLQGTDNDYYLKHDYKKEYSKYGSIYIKTGCDINDVNSNVILYGHNMRDDEMFNSLLKYVDKSYYDEHKIVNITTESEEREYEIIAVFKSRVFYQNEENVFRYYNYLNFANEHKYKEYLTNVKAIQLYDTGVKAEFGEQLLTMITCEYSQENGRMVVVAKRIK